MRRLLLVAALLGGASIVQGPPVEAAGVCEAPFDRPTSDGSCVPMECPDGTLPLGTEQTCACEFDTSASVLQWGDDGSSEQVMDPADCPADVPVVEDCADAPGCVLGATVERLAAVPVPVGVAPAFTG